VASPTSIFLRQLGHGLAGRIALGDLAALTNVEGGGSTELLAEIAGLGDAFLAKAPLTSASSRLTQIPPGMGRNFSHVLSLVWSAR
jgi:hypothetical protein